MYIDTQNVQGEGERERKDREKLRCGEGRER